MCTRAESLQVSTRITPAHVCTLMGTVDGQLWLPFCYMFVWEEIACVHGHTESEGWWRRRDRKWQATWAMIITCKLSCKQLLYDTYQFSTNGARHQQRVHEEVVTSTHPPPYPTLPLITRTFQYSILYQTCVYNIIYLPSVHLCVIRNNV